MIHQNLLLKTTNPTITHQSHNHDPPQPFRRKYVRTYLACFGLGPSAAASAWSASELPWTSLAPTAAFLEALLGSDGAAHAALPTVVGSARSVAGSTIGIRARGHPCLRPCANTCRRSLPSGSCPGWTGGSEGFRSCQHSVAASARANCLHSHLPGSDSSQCSQAAWLTGPRSGMRKLCARPVGNWGFIPRGATRTESANGFRALSWRRWRLVC